MLMKQNHKISDENRHALKLCASATECVSKRIEEKSEGSDSKVNHSAWIKLKKCVPTTCFFTKSKNKEGCDNENNKHDNLIGMSDNQHE